MEGGDRRTKSLQGSSSSFGLVSERALQEVKLPASLCSSRALHSLQAERAHKRANPTFLMLVSFNCVIQQNVVQYFKLKSEGKNPQPTPATLNAGRCWC